MFAVGGFIALLSMKADCMSLFVPTRNRVRYPQTRGDMAKTPARLIALSAATGGLFGYMIAVSNDAIDSVRTELQLTR